MSDWQVGDLAVCVKAQDGYPWKPTVGVIYTVSGVDLCDDDEVGLDLEEDAAGYDPQWLWDAAAFRKIRPDECEACEPEFVTLLQRIKRKQPA